MKRSCLGWTVLLLAASVLVWSSPWAQSGQADKENNPSAGPEKKEASSDAPADGSQSARPAEKLSAEQQALAERYRRLEQVLLRMAELTASQDPRRAALLRKAVQMSNEELINVQFERLVQLLKEEKLADALDNQKELKADLAALLELLLSETRGDQLASEIARHQAYLREINRLIKSESG
ncbi:MAG TPA: hypothetical protein PK777_13845, partial [Thermoguttaceae bacterium]|nr:hypothetical protein [Thermoguttaceae bacterium]